MVPPEDEANGDRWLESDTSPWVSELFKLPEDRAYDEVTTRLLAEAHAAEYVTNDDIRALGTDFAEILTVIIGIIQSNGIDPQKQIQEWNLFRE